MEIPASELQRVRDLYNRGRYREALAVGGAFAPPRQWAGAPSRLMAGRLAIQLGAPRMGHQLHLAAYREFPANLEAIYYHARYRLETFGPLSAVTFMRQHEDWSDAPPGLRADWLAVHALVAARLADHDRAERYLAQAEAGAVDRAWVYVERSSVLEVLERPAEAMEAARHALAIQPWFRPGVQAVAHLLQQAGRVPEAIDFLAEAGEHIDGGVVPAQLATMQYDLGRHADTRRSLDRYEELSPLIEPEVRKWLDARRADVAYLLGEPHAAVPHAEAVGDDFYRGFAKALTVQPDGVEALAANRCILPLDLSYATKSPTALELLGRHHGVETPAAPADAAPTPDGLPNSAERRRLNDAGWLTREFTLDAEIAFELIARGLPFLVTLVETGYGQARLVLGVDRVRRTVFFVEGSERRAGEAPLSVLFERYAAFGPRCLVAVPGGQGAKLDGLTFPEAADYDALYAIQCELQDRDFGRAEASLAALRSERPEARLTKFAGLAWARAIGHPVLQLEALEGLAADHPKDATLILSRAAALRDLGRMRERRAVLAAAHGAGVDDALLMQSLAQMDLPTPDRRVETERLLRRSIRLRPQGAPGYFLLATQHWENQDFDTALELYRQASCLDDRESQFAEAYSRAARVRGQSGDALRLFQQRAQRHPLPHPPAVEALFNTLNDRGDVDFAVTALGQSIERAAAGTTPEAAQTAGELRLFRAEAHANAGRFADAEKDLAAARGDTPDALWLRIAAKVARLKPDYRESLNLVRELLRREPLSADNHRLAAALITDTEGRAEARRHLRKASQTYPQHYGLARLYAEFVYPDQDDESVRATQRLVELCDRDAWAHRQLALIHADRKRHAEASRAIARAAQLEPQHTSHYAVQAHVHRRADRIDDALQTFRDCLAEFPDHELAIFEMVQLSRGEKEKRASLEYLAAQLHRRPHTGDGLLAYQTHAGELVDSPEDLEALHAELERFLEERPDLWQAWSAVIQTLANGERAEEAAALAREATERFPLSPRLWIDRAIIHKVLEQPEEQIDALRQAVAIAPGWVPAVRELAETLGEAGQRGDALAALEGLLPRAAADAHAHWVVAEQLWQADRGREALDRAKQAIRLDTAGDPRLEYAWRAVLAWCERLDAPEEGLEFARELTAERAGDPRAWLRFARTITEVERAGEIVEALDKALALDPKNVEAYDLKAERLAMLGRFDEALEAARPMALAAEMPLVLQGRAAWVEARRGNYASAIPPMQALVAVDPEYLWGWQQLADWYNEVGKPESYLEASGELMRLRPESPYHLMMRGDAKIQTGDREGGKADLREALRMHAGYSPAAVVLFDACLQDGEHREARGALAVLQEHLAGPEVLVKQIQFAARTNDGEGAVRAFKELATTPGEAPPMYLQMALTEMHSADRGEAAAEVLREAWESGEAFNPWAAMFWMETPDGEHSTDEERLAACDAVVKHYPQLISGHDRRAEILTILGRYDEATAACKPAEFPPPYPLALQGRAAWVVAQKGDRAGAVERMKAILAEDPDYTWGWRQLTTWYEATGRERERLEAADHLVRLNPRDALVHLIRGEARQALGDNRGAKDDFEQAFDIDPAFQAAGLQLITAQLETGDLPGAARSLAVLREHADGPYVKLRAIQVAARQGNLDEARQTFRAMLTDLSVSRGVLQDSITNFREAGWLAEAEEELTNATQDDDVTPQAAAIWTGTLMMQNKAWKVADELSPLVGRNRDAGREAVLAYAVGMIASGPAQSGVLTVQRFAELLRQDDDAWARAGSVLVDAKQYEQAVAWLADWEERPEREAWMLRVLFDAYQHLGLDGRAESIARTVVDAEDADDDFHPDFLSWLALYAALRGESDAADDFLDRVEPVGQPDGVRVVLKMAEALITVQRGGGRDAAFREAKRDLHAAAESCAPKDRLPGTARAYRRAVARLAADAGTLSAKLWALGQRVRPWIKDAP